MSTKASSKSKPKAKTIARFHSVKAALMAGHSPRAYRPATISEKLGPDFKPLVWIGTDAYVLKEPDAVPTEVEVETAAAQPELQSAVQSVEHDPLQSGRPVKQVQA